jgi:hypothetical protein
MGSSATTSNTAGDNDNKESHDQRQGNLQKNINKLKAKGATAESIAGLKAKKEKEAKQFKQNTQGIKEGRAYVADKLGLKTNQTNGSSTQTKSYGAYNLKGKDIDFYGEEAEAATQEYLRKQGEITNNIISKQGLKMKFGKSNTAMGSGDPTGIMTSTKISEKMFESQRRVQGALIAGLSFTVPMFAGQIMRGIAADTMNSNYSNYLNKFNKNMQSNKSFKARNTGVNQQANNETANLAFGNTDTTQVANKSKTSKKTTKYLAGIGSDELSNKRTFYS